MHDQLHAAGFVEKTLDDKPVTGWESSQNRQRGGEVTNDLIGGFSINTGNAHQPMASPLDITGTQPLLDPAAKRADLFGQFDGSAGSFTEPNGNGRRKALRVDDPNNTRFDTPNPPAVGAQGEDVTGHRLGRPVLVDRADEGVVGVEQDPVVAKLRDSPTARERSHSRATTATYQVVDLVVMNPMRPHTSTSRDPIGGDFDAPIEILPSEIPVGRSPRDQTKQLVDVPLPSGGLGHELLDQDVEGSLGRQQSVEVSGAHCAQKRAALDEVVSGLGEQPALGHAIAIVVCASDPLQERRDVARRSDLADKVDRADIDAEFERSGRDQSLEVPVTKTLLDDLASLL